MTLIFGLVGFLVLAAALLAVFMNADPRRLAYWLRLAGPAGLALAGAALLVLGQAAFGGVLIAAALLVSGRVTRRQAPGLPEGKRSSVRTAALEMELDHDSGKLEGLVLAGRHEMKTLAALDLKALLEVLTDLRGDSESRRLLETYLDGRFPVWRKHAQTNHRHGHGVAPGARAMTKEEAYKVLGLESGATTADVRQAHRRLMQRLHSDLSGTSLLAARINQAKDVLLSNHG